MNAVTERLNGLLENVIDTACTYAELQQVEEDLCDKGSAAEADQVSDYLADLYEELVNAVLTFTDSYEGFESMLAIAAEGMESEGLQLLEAVAL